MDVGGTRRIESAAARRTGRAAASSSSGTFAADEVYEARAPALTGTAPLAAIDTILALQSLSDSPGERERTVRRGEDLLALLDQVRDGLLMGGIPRSILNRLAMAAARRPGGFADPGLSAVLDEIELRALVELAKLEQAESANV